jgi:alpha-L-arabinofuranosidase
MYSLNKGTKVVPVTLNNDVVAGQDSLYAAACIDTRTNDLIIKLVNASGKEQMNTVNLEGVKKLAAEGSLMVLKSDDLYSVNSFDAPQHVAPKESTMAIKGRKINFTAAPYSFSVLRIKMM